MAGWFRAMLNAYNAGLYHAAAINHTPALIQACGGVDGLAVALEQNHLIEELDYELHSLKITGTNPDGTVDADITISSVDPATGQLWDDHLALGWSFKQANGQWLVAADYFPFGVGAFC